MQSQGEWDACAGLGLSTKSLEALKVPVIPTVLFNRPEELPRRGISRVKRGLDAESDHELW